MKLLPWFYWTASIWLLCGNSLQAQETDPTLFSVAGKPVGINEFTYIYTKTGADKADFSEKSLREYLQLYIDFKLQVQKAKDLGLQDSSQVKAEQAMYRRQLANSYLTEREISEKLVKEAYERSKEDRELLHLLISVDKNASPAEVQAAEAKIQALAKTCTPNNFAEMVAQHSQDNYSKSKGGSLGFFTALQLPYDLETALYSQASGQVVGPVRSPYGFHLVKIGQIRPARGQMQVAQLFLRDSPEAKNRMDSIYQALQKGASFRDLVLQLSQDNQSKGQEGLLGWIGINQYSEDFEDQIFALSKDGSYSKPFQSKAGWHILLRLKALKNPSFNDIKGELKDRISKDARYQVVLKALVERIKKEGDFKLDPAVKADFLAKIQDDKTFTTYAWKPSAEMLNDERVIFRLGKDFKASFKELAQFASQAAQERFGNQPASPALAFEAIFEKFEANRCLAFEEEQLEKKYPEFRNLLREYEEGILLFEVKRRLIWEQAPRDTTGLKNFYEANRSKYQWQPRAEVSFYTVRSTDAKLVKSIAKVAKSKNPEVVKEQFNKDNILVQVSQGVYEKGRNAEVDRMNWKKGSLSPVQVNAGVSLFSKIENVIGKGQKTYEDARGYVITDYQGELEKQLLKELRAKYSVEIDEAVLKSLIKK